MKFSAFFCVLNNIFGLPQARQKNLFLIGLIDRLLIKVNKKET